MSEPERDAADVDRFWRPGGVKRKVTPGEFTVICSVRKGCYGAGRETHYERIAATGVWARGRLAPATGLPRCARNDRGLLAMAR